mgnify:CR=1 FL=1
MRHHYSRALLRGSVRTGDPELGLKRGQLRQPGLHLGAALLDLARRARARGGGGSGGGGGVAGRLEVDDGEVAAVDVEAIEPVDGGARVVHVVVHYVRAALRRRAVAPVK